MAEIISNLGLGFGVAFSLTNFALCFLGVLVGTLIGVLPGVGPIATIAMSARPAKKFWGARMGPIRLT